MSVSETAARAPPLAPDVPRDGTGDAGSRSMRVTGFLQRLKKARAEWMRQGLTVALVGMLALSGYGTLVPASARCVLPGAVGCAGGLLGPVSPAANATNEMFFTITMYDYGFWIVNDVSGANESGTWTVYEGWTIHINATSVRADPSVGGAAYHGIGIELNATGHQLLSLAAPVGKWVSASFVAPTSPYYRQHIWCTIECGDGHSNMYVYNLNIVSAAFIPSVSASANVTSGSAPLSVALTAKVSGGTPPYTQTWNFGDGSATVTTLNATHVYTLSGTYGASIKVVDSKGYSASGSVTIKVTSASALAASAQATPSSGYAPLLATLASTVNGGVAPYTYQWSFGDGTTSTAASPQHIFSAPGVYGPSLTVTDSTGATATAQATVTVTAPTGHLTVTASASPTSGTAPLAAQLSATATGGSAPYTTAWVFGDGSLGTGSPASHTFAVQGMYEATAFVTDATGRVGSAVVAVTVSGTVSHALQAIVTESPSSGSPPLAINASLSAIGGTAPYPKVSWSFGDGATGTGPVVAHTYATLGTYTLTATVTDSLGASAAATAVVKVAGVVLSITTNRTSGDAPFSVSAAATEVGGTGVYNPVQWAWGDGTTSTGSTANHTYAANVTGAVVIQAVTADSAGQKANASATVQIHPAPSVSLLVAISTPSSPPVSVNFSLHVTGGTGNYTPLPLWSFGDGTSTRASSPVNHTYQRPGHYLVTVQTNDSAGVVATGQAWVNISTGGLAGGVGLGGGGAAQWVFTGVDNPDQAALALMGLVAFSGLALLYRAQRTKLAAAEAKAARAAQRPAAPAAASSAPRPAVRMVRVTPAVPPARPSAPAVSSLPPGWSPPPPSAPPTNPSPPEW
ncbi:MAG TPA: PKD domain-containing protein [Thermoplasmata archaeon]|nr:PKD domain-containing protein [Thermoplasmata archaeon]